MSHFSSRSDDQLNATLQGAAQIGSHILVDFLQELQRRRSADAMHKPDRTLLGKSGEVFEVFCTCGKRTQYKVPLTTIDDFECPNSKKRVKGGKAS